MTNRVSQRAAALILAVCLLIVSGAAYGQVVAHAVQHAHHKAATHGTAVCSWVCSAGQVLEGITVALPVNLGPLAFASLPAHEDWSSAVRLVSSSRGPPPVLA